MRSGPGGSFDCEPDYNEDGIVDQLDLQEKRQDLINDLIDWIRNCWRPAMQNGDDDCGADYNEDGSINRQDLTEKLQDTISELREWIQDCWAPEMGFGRGTADGSGVIETYQKDAERYIKENTDSLIESQ